MPTSGRGSRTTAHPALRMSKQRSKKMRQSAPLQKSRLVSQVQAQKGKTSTAPVHHASAGDGLPSVIELRAGGLPAGERIDLGHVGFLAVSIGKGTQRSGKAVFDATIVAALRLTHWLNVQSAGSRLLV
ncbi:hypothetical protein BAUCODRAFT_143934 [Baudoinia panamericana UAMH 10762]|uniref:Uncharacterized protein n=1 Tax=Baudoinia panamericana (strain UAMH 10762) TaxID=717646 RepID=M2LAU6_BAUPA|nr:uncharacterized protein BAUCODRAFT_143934 [Baudoinia panamericana UAMH 10762]EMC90937.1 hypothetical protein BAUCODRAFT_143934 [Baudoinia panamericana UAMH 10762]